MNKDVIYVDIDDDIADIVDKVVDSDKRLVALVLPKNIGALRSVVNLKLLARSAKDADKLIALVTPNSAILPLASQAKLAVAKSLQDRPIIPEVREAENPVSNIIDNDDGVVAVVSDGETEEEKVDEVLDDDVLKEEDKKDEKTPKVPSFDKLRNRIIIAVSALAVLVIGFVVLKIMLVPEASISVVAATSTKQLAEQITFTTNPTEEDIDKGVFLLQEHEIVKKSESEFEPTGEKLIGEKATGKITVTNCTGSVLNLTSGLKFTHDGLVYTATSAADVPAFDNWNYSQAQCVSSGSGAGKVTVNVQAEAIGNKYNIGDGKSFTFAKSSASITAVGSAMTGGESKAVKVVSEEDYNLAKAGLASVNETAGKREALNSLAASLKPIGDETTVVMVVKEIEVMPKVGEETTLTTGKMTQETSFKAYGVSTAKLEAFIEKKVLASIEGKSELKVYDTGINEARIDSYTETDGKPFATLKSITKIGPNISENQIREIVAGKKFNEAVSGVQALNSISDVTIDFNYFWVNTVPKDFKRIFVEFNVNE